MRLLIVGLVLLVIAAVASGAPEKESLRGSLAAVNTRRITGADKEPHNWLAHGRTYGEQRWSPLKQINDATVTKLGLAWHFDAGTRRGLEATPIVVDGITYTTGSWSVVFANDARTGMLIWKHDPQVPREWNARACCDVVNRGVALYEGKVFVGTLDGRLVALDALTGVVLWEINTIDRSKPYTITGAPRVVKGKVVIGNGGADYGVRGYVTAYDANTGRQLWRFYTVPGNPSKPFESKAMEMAAKTWKGGEWWTVGGGGTVWDSMAYDPVLDLLYIGVGNGAPWNRYIRSPGGGDNLFLSSIVALNPDTGEYVWHYQTTPGDTWDYTATQHMILADLKIDGETRKVILQAPKNGFFYVLDRASGRFVSAEPYVRVNWATHVDPKTGRPVETKEQYREKEKLTLPSPFGGHNWHPMSFSPDTGLVYIPAVELPFIYKHDSNFQYNPRTLNLGIDPLPAVPRVGMDQMLTLKIMRALAKGHLSAWDPVRQKEAWRVPHAGPGNGGVLSTAGNLVFQGTADGRLAAYAADTGKRLWEAPTQSGVIAPPVTYMVDGEQYVAVMAGWGGSFAQMGGAAASFAKYGPEGRLLAYKLGGTGELPPYNLPPRRLPEPPKLTASDDVVNQGNRLYHTHCHACHGAGAVSASTVADLRYMTAATHQAFTGIVLGGIYRDRGMVSFAGVLSAQDVEALHAYLIKRAHDELNEKESSSLWLKLKGVFYSIVAFSLELLLRLKS